MSNIDKIKKRLRELLKKEEKVVICIKGKWGVGKTFFWDKFVEEELKEKNTVYISLFGKKSLEEIKTEALVQIYSQNKYIGKLKDFLSKLNSTDLKITTSKFIMNSALSLFEKKELSDVIICIDDFERRNDELKIEEILGFVSILAERNLCKIVIIMNESELKDDDKTYDRYREKVVDYTFNFDPNFNDSINLLKIDIDPEQKEIVRERLKEINENNLRTIAKVYRNVIDVSSYIVMKDVDPKAKSEIFDYITMLSILYEKKGKNGLDELNEYNFMRLSDKVVSDMSVSDDDVAYFDIYVNYLSKDVKLHKLIWEYLDSSLIDDGEFNNEVKELSDDVNLLSAKKEYRDIFDKHIYDMQYRGDDFVKDSLKFFNKHKNNLIKIIGKQNIFFYKDRILEVASEEDQIDSIIKDSFEKYLQEIIKNEPDIFSVREAFENDKYISMFFDKYHGVKNKILGAIDDKVKDSYNCGQICRIIDQINKNSSWDGNDEYFLNSISEEIIKDCLLQDSNFFRLLFIFFRTYRNISQFGAFTSKFISALDSIADRGQDYKIKVGISKSMLGLNTSKS